MKESIKYLLSCFLIFMASSVSGQEVEMADTMRSEGKIYVVVAIIILVLAGFFLYLFLLDRKVTRIEKSLRDNIPN